MSEYRSESVGAGSDLSLATLDQWESELDRFTAEIMQRLADLGGGPSRKESPGLLLQQFLEAEAEAEAEEEDDVMKIWRAVNDMRQ